MKPKTGAEAEPRGIPPIPDTPENIARAIMRGPPKTDWDYLKRSKPPADEGDDQPPAPRAALR